MQYFGRALGSVTKSWSSINPSTLSGAVDVIVVQHADGELSCSPFHVRFGKFQILKPSQKTVDVSINGQPTTIPMKLSEYGEAYFVFETEMENVPDDLVASPMASASSSPLMTPQKTQKEISTTSQNTQEKNEYDNSGSNLEEPDFLDINEGTHSRNSQETKSPDFKPNSKIYDDDEISAPVTSPVFTPIQEKLEKIKIPTKLDNLTGDLLLDIEGYKYNQDKVHDSDELVKQILQEEFGEDAINKMVEKDAHGNIRIINQSGPSSPGSFDRPHSPVSSGDQIMGTPESGDGSSPYILESNSTGTLTTNTSTTDNNILSLEGHENSQTPIPDKKYIKTIRLTSDQLRCLNLKMGVNEIQYSIANGKSFLTANLFLWKWDTPIVISDIDGTITKSDALGHVMTMIGKDWTHPGVAKLFNDIYNNGYNIMYLTARSAGLADSTRAYLKTIDQDGGYKIPQGPVILSPDRTFTALKREVILKKPEVFKMACLNDIRQLYLKDLSLGSENLQMETPTKSTINKNNAQVFGVDEDIPTPFIAGFGNRITDGISYRSVGIPKSRIFTINPDGEVHMELLELSGYKYSYLYINELVDHFFPPVITNDDGDLECFDELDGMGAYPNASNIMNTSPLPSVSSSSSVTNNNNNNNNNNTNNKVTDESGDLIPGYSIFTEDADGVRSRSSSIGVHPTSFDLKTNGNLNSGTTAHNATSQNDEELNSMNTRLSNTAHIHQNLKKDSSKLYGKKMSLFRNKEEKFSDVNFWREPLPDISDLSDISDEDGTYGSETKEDGNLKVGNKSFDNNDFQFSNRRNTSPISNNTETYQKNTSRKSSISHNRTKSNDSGFFGFLSREKPRNDSGDNIRGKSNEEELNDNLNLSTPSGSPYLGGKGNISPLIVEKGSPTSMTSPTQIKSDGAQKNTQTDNERTFEYNNYNQNYQQSAELGKQIYLSLGSPLSSPKLESLDLDNETHRQLLDSTYGLDTPTKVPIMSNFDTSNIISEHREYNNIKINGEISGNHGENLLFENINPELTDGSTEQSNYGNNIMNPIKSVTQNTTTTVNTPMIPMASISTTDNSRNNIFLSASNSSAGVIDDDTYDDHDDDEFDDDEFED